MSGRYAFSGVHVPACVDVDAHIAAAVAESSGHPESLDAFVDRVRTAWADEQMIADQGDAAVIEHWRRVEVDFMRLQASL
jgi:hypothetical protein